jgi:hypothetical protein
MLCWSGQVQVLGEDLLFHGFSFFFFSLSTVQLFAFASVNGHCASRAILPITADRRSL